MHLRDVVNELKSCERTGAGVRGKRSGVSTNENSNASEGSLPLGVSLCSVWRRVAATVGTTPQLLLFGGDKVQRFACAGVDFARCFLLQIAAASGTSKRI